MNRNQREVFLILRKVFPHIKKETLMFAWTKAGAEEKLKKGIALVGKKKAIKVLAETITEANLIKKQGEYDGNYSIDQARGITNS